MAAPWAPLRFLSAAACGPGKLLGRLAHVAGARARMALIRRGETGRTCATTTEAQPSATAMATPVSPVPPVATRAELEAAVRAGVRPCSDDSAVEAFRFSNFSFPSYSGMVVKATTVGVGKKGAFVDTGVRGVARVRVPPSLADTTVPGAEAHVLVDAIEGPDGEVYASLAKTEGETNRAEVWSELKSLHQGKRMVQGRLLNRVGGNAGWAVGIAGVVAFAPRSRVLESTTTRLGVLVPWYIMSIDSASQSILVKDAAMED